MTTELFEFPPFEAPEIEALADRRQVRDAIVARLDGYRPLMIDIDIPLRDHLVPVVVWLHGGGWMWGTGKHTLNPLPTKQIRDAVFARGIAFATFDYRLICEAAWPAQLHDVKSALRWLRRHAEVLGIDSVRMAVWGESAGGHLAALAATTAHRADLEGSGGVVGESSAVAACVDWYGPSDLTPYVTIEPVATLVGADPGAARDASPVHQVTAGAASLLAVHGLEDSLVPVGDSIRLVDAYRASGAPARYVPVPGAGHAFAGTDPTDAIAQSIEFLVDELV